MRTQQRPQAPPMQEQKRQEQERDPFEGMDTFDGQRGLPPRRGRDADPPGEMTPTVLKPDAMRDSPLAQGTGRGQELDGIDEVGAGLNWVSLDSPRGVLVCKNLDLEVPEFIGTILESRVVRVMKESDGTVFCASSSRLVADVGRPGRECGPCEDRGVNCFARWWIAWKECRTGGEQENEEIGNGEIGKEETGNGEGQIFAHTLSQTGTLNFSRYVAKLQRDGLKPSQVLTRLFVEEARRQKTNTVYRRLQFERADPFP